MPKITIVLPVFNGQEFLRDCIKSALEQTLGDFELLIGNDSSNDMTSAIMRSFSDPRIKFFDRETNLGLFKNLNKLIMSANSPLIHMLCQDDVLERHCLQEEADFFSKNPGVGMSFCKAYRIDKAGGVISKYVLGDLPNVVDTELSRQCFFYHGCMPGNLSTVCIRKESFDKAGLFNEEYRAAADYEMWVRICEREDLGVIHKHLVRLRCHPGQLSRTADSAISFIRENRQVRAKLLPLLPKEIRFGSRRYVRLRQNVLDTHYALRVLSSGRIKDCLKILNIMGPKDFSLGLLWWTLTLNNHLYRPKPLFK